jgi:hypothetical protein
MTWDFYILLAILGLAGVFLFTTLVFAWLWKRELRLRRTAEALEYLAQESAKSWYERYCHAKGFRTRLGNIPVLDDWLETLDEKGA